MAASSIRDVVEAFEDGRFRLAQPLRKIATSTWSNGLWVDTTMLAGQPLPSYYASAPLTFAPMARSTHGGWDHGPSVAPFTKYIKNVAIFTPAYSSSGFLIDVLGYYPFIDEAIVGEPQNLDNTQTLPRRTDGNGVRAFAVSVAPSALVAGNTVTITYTNEKGVSGRTSPAVLLQNLVNPNGALLSMTTANGFGPLMPLADGDRGIRSIESVQVDGPGDSGLFTIVLCRPICSLPPNVGDGIVHSASYVEHDYLRTSPVLPVIDDDSFLSVIFGLYRSNSATISLVNFYATLDVFWS